MSHARVRISILVSIVLLSLLCWFSSRPESPASMTFPNPIYTKDDILYFEPGPDFPIADEEAVLEEVRQ